MCCFHLLYHFGVFQLSFPPLFPTLSKGYATGSVLLAILLHASLNLAAGPLPTVLGSSSNALSSLLYTGLIVGLTIIVVIVAGPAHPSPQPSEHPQEERAGVDDSRSSCFFFSLWQLSLPLNRQTQAKVSCDVAYLVRGWCRFQCLFGIPTAFATSLGLAIA